MRRAGKDQLLRWKGGETNGGAVLEGNTHENGRPALREMRSDGRGRVVCGSWSLKSRGLIQIYRRGMVHIAKREGRV